MKENPQVSSAAGPFLRRSAAIEWVGLRPRTFQRYVSEGKLPPPLKVSPRMSLFSRPALDLAMSRFASEGAQS